MQTEARPLLILGTRLLAEEVADLVSETPGLELAGFVENLERDRCEEPLNGLPVHWVDEIGALAKTHQAVCALSTTHRRLFVEQVSDLGMRFATVIHPSARISRTSTVGEGSIVSAGVIVAAHTSLGRHVFVNRGALIGHHTAVADYVTIQPGANVAGACKVGEATYIGLSAVVLERKTIGAHSVVGAGAVVTKDVPDQVEVVGVPARIVKEGIEGR